MLNYSFPFSDAYLPVFKVVMHAEKCTQTFCVTLGKQSPQNKQIWSRNSYKVEIITLAEPHETITIKSFPCPLKICNTWSLLIVSSLGRHMVKYADNQNSIWFIFSAHGYPVYMNIKHKMQLMALASKPRQATTVCVCVWVPLPYWASDLSWLFPSTSLQKVFMFLEGETLCRLWSRGLVIFESKCGGNIPNILTGLLQRKSALCWI